MQMDDHQDNSNDSSRPNSPGHQVNSPTFVNAHQSNVPLGYTSPAQPPYSYSQNPIFGSFQPNSQTFTTTLPPISINSGSPPIGYSGPGNIPFIQNPSPPLSFPPGFLLPQNISQQHFQPPPPTITTNYDMVPRSQFQKCAQQCHIWSIKYKQLNTKYTNLLKERGSQSHDINLNKLREQNYHLEQRIQAYQSAERQLAGNIQIYISDLINKYKQQTLRQTTQLFQRFKLECRNHQRQ